MAVRARACPPPGLSAATKAGSPNRVPWLALGELSWASPSRLSCKTRASALGGMLRGSRGLLRPTTSSASPKKSPSLSGRRGLVVWVTSLRSLSPSPSVSATRGLVPRVISGPSGRPSSSVSALVGLVPWANSSALLRPSWSGLPAAPLAGLMLPLSLGSSPYWISHSLGRPSESPSWENLPIPIWEMVLISDAVRVAS